MPYFVICPLHYNYEDEMGRGEHKFGRLEDKSLQENCLDIYPRPGEYDNENRSGCPPIIYPTDRMNLLRKALKVEKYPRQLCTAPDSLLGK